MEPRYQLRHSDVESRNRSLLYTDRLPAFIFFTVNDNYNKSLCILPATCQLTVLSAFQTFILIFHDSHFTNAETEVSRN